MTGLQFVTADVFTRTRFGGNPVAVFPQCPPLADDLLQAIARELNLSETVFVFPPRNPGHTRRVRIFTPARELAFAGHPTIGCAIILAEKGHLGEIGAAAEIVLEEGAGPVPVRLERRAEGLFATLTAPKLPSAMGAKFSGADLAPMIGLEVEDLVEGLPPGRYDSGGPKFQFVPVKDRHALARAALDVALWRRLLSQDAAQEVYVLTMEDWTNGREIRARMFGPSVGVVEDPATGSAAAALARFLAEMQRPGEPSRAWTIHQGVEMGRPSLLELRGEFEGRKLARVEVGGAAVLQAEGHFLAL